MQPLINKEVHYTIKKSIKESGINDFEALNLIFTQEKGYITQFPYGLTQQEVINLKTLKMTKKPEKPSKERLRANHELISLIAKAQQKTPLEVARQLARKKEKEK